MLEWLRAMRSRRWASAAKSRKRCRRFLTLEKRLSTLIERVEGPRPQGVSPDVTGGKLEGPPALALSVRRLRETLNRCSNDVSQLEDRL